MHTDTQAPPLAVTAGPRLAPPVQVGPPFRCWECGSPDTGGHAWVPCRSPLDPWAEHIYYMRLACGHAGRSVRLGDCLAPLEFVVLPAAEFDRQIGLNLAAIRGGLSTIARARRPEARHADPAARIVYGLIAGTLAPEPAIAQLHALGA